jgi:hypothetical protein
VAEVPGGLPRRRFARRSGGHQRYRADAGAFGLNEGLNLQRPHVLVGLLATLGNRDGVSRVVSVIRIVEKNGAKRAGTSMDFPLLRNSRGTEAYGKRQELLAAMNRFARQRTEFESQPNS